MALCALFSRRTDRRHDSSITAHNVLDDADVRSEKGIAMQISRLPGWSRFGTALRRGPDTIARVPWTAPVVTLGALVLCITGTLANDPIRRAVPPRVLIVGGGPDLHNNQVAIESNVRYVNKLLPADSPRTTLFADGDSNHATVLYDDAAPVPAGEKILDLVLPSGDASDAGSRHYKKPNLGAKLDGASKKPEIQQALSQFGSSTEDPQRPILLYFTGHGSRNGNDLENNQYDLWGGKEGITVRELSREIARLPEATPVTIVMVQCFSGAFGNLIFENGDPKGEPIQRDFAGFFATVKERVAAGCTSAVNEEEYHDFTSYFFAALTGRDRVGRRVTGADYDGDGRVGMDEAYCYTLIHDDSIDVPVCTSDVFLRRYVPLKDAEVFQTPYSSVLAWSTPAQRAALEALSTTLNRHGDNRLTVSYDRMIHEMSGMPAWRTAFREATQRFETVRREARRTIQNRWPDLRRPDTDDYKRAYNEAAAQLGREAAAGKWKELLDASDAMDRADQAGETQEIAASRNLRYVRLGKSVIIAHWLKEHGTPELKARFARLTAAEARTPFAPFEPLGRAPGMQPASRTKSAMQALPALRRSDSCCRWDGAPVLRNPPTD